MKETETNTSNQASSLEDLIAEVQQGNGEDHSEPNLRLGSDKEIKIDVLSLPPRSEVHTTKKRTHIRMSRPMKRLIFMIIVLILLISGSLYYFGEELIDLFTSS